MNKLFDGVNSFASHMPILRKIFDNNKIKSVIETGMGDYSTRFFCDRGVKLVSIEMQYRVWYEKIEREYKGENREFHCRLDKDWACDYIKGSQPVDLIMVDGHHYSRFRQVQEAFRKAKFIVAHDTEAMIYRWDRIKLPPFWKWVEIEEADHMPWTSLIAHKTVIRNQDWLKLFKHTVYDDVSNKKYVHLKTQEDI